MFVQIPQLTIHIMKRLVLLFLLAFFLRFHARAQQSKAREIVNLALKKHTSGEILVRYELKEEYQNPGRTPDYLYQKDELLLMIDSVYKTMPDSTQKRIAQQMADMKEKMYIDRAADYVDNKRWFYVDLKAGKISQTQVKPNPLNGNIDSSRASKKFDNEYQFRETLKMNPVALLQVMGENGELNYVGISNVNSNDYFIVQVKVKDKWLAVYIDRNDYTVSFVSEDMVDNDPVLGVGPEYSKRHVFYRDYRKVGPFLLPGGLEEIASRGELTTRKTLDWITINKPIPDSLFETRVFRNPDREIRYIEISPGLFVEKTSDRWINNRSLIRMNNNNSLDIFTSLPDKPEYVNREIESLITRFPGASIGNIYTVSALYEVGSFNNVFSKKIHITGPKGRGFLSESRVQRNYYQKEAWANALKNSKITTFDKEFESNSIIGIILNIDSSSESDALDVAYYLPKEKLVYVNGRQYQSGMQKALKIDKQLSEAILSRKIKVDRIIYSEAYNSTTPLFESYKDFENRIKNTDFSIYNKAKR